MKYLLLFGILLLVGCASEQTQDNGLQETSNPGTERTVQEPTPVKTGIVEKAIDNAKSKLVETMANQIVYKADYDVVAQGQTSQMTQYFKGGNMRMDITAQGFEMRSYLLEDRFYACNMATGSWMCQEIAYQKDVSQDVQENIQNYEVTELPSRVIAGTTADCYLVKAEQGDVEYCYAEYVPLYIKTSASEMTATSYSKSVSSSDLELPAEPGVPIDPSQLMAGYT
jgi:hypothetical protein